jgi:hypothetical protein
MINIIRVITILIIAHFIMVKTELCLFIQRDVAPITINLGNNQIILKKELNVLGVIFDSKIQWSNQVNSLILKSDKALSSIKLIGRYFNTFQLLQIFASNNCSVLYNNCEVW